MAAPSAFQFYGNNIDLLKLTDLSGVTVKMLLTTSTYVPDTTNTGNTVLARRKPNLHHGEVGELKLNGYVNLGRGGGGGGGGGGGSRSTGSSKSTVVTIVEAEQAIVGVVDEELEQVLLQWFMED